MQLTPLDLTNREHVARQMILTALVGERLTRPRALSEGSERNLERITDVLTAHCAELHRILEGRAATAEHLAQSAQSARQAVLLIEQMLDGDPRLLSYDPRTIPQHTAELLLHHLVHALNTFVRLIRSQQYGTA
jgi:hypothetical protein